MQIAVDIGGTFTDVVASRDGVVWTLKIPSTPADLSVGVVEGVREVLRISDSAPGDVQRFVHGTTVATNAVLERKGARVGLLMTEGFEDILELGRQKRSSMYDLFMAPETPTFLAPGRRRRGIPERVDADGEVIRTLDEAAVTRAVAELVAVEEIEALAVCYLFSFLNPNHEERTRAIISSAFPGLDVSLSSQVDPVFREYERTCVTAFDAYVRPVVARYVKRLHEALAELGITTRMLIMQSRGSIASADRAANRPVTTLLSGPAAGALGGKVAGESAGFQNLITFDMGGTRKVRWRSHSIGACSSPSAASTPGRAGTIIVLIFRRSAIIPPCTGPAPPSMTSAWSRGSTPRLTVSTRTASAMAALQTV
jgi:N-methylhydantoinase A